MISTTLSLWGKGSVTLPKKWRDKHDTKHFIAEENEKGHLVIKPVINVEYWEKKDGSFGLHFPEGIEAGEFAKMLRKANKELDRQEKLNIYSKKKAK